MQPNGPDERKRRGKTMIKRGIFTFIIVFIALAALAPGMAAAAKEKKINPSEVGETYVGGVVADAMIAALGADVALIDGGSLGYKNLPEKLTKENLPELVPFSDDPVAKCPQCKGKVRRVISPVGVIFKGSGWYITDNRRQISGSGKPQLSDKTKDSKSDGAAEKASGKSDGDKPADKPKAKGEKKEKAAAKAAD